MAPGDFNLEPQKIIVPCHDDDQQAKSLIFNSESQLLKSLVHFNLANSFKTYSHRPTQVITAELQPQKLKQDALVQELRQLSETIKLLLESDNRSQLIMTMLKTVGMVLGASTEASEQQTQIMARMQMSIQDAFRTALDSQRQNEKYHAVDEVPDDELHAVTVLRKSKVYHTLGACTKCLKQLNECEIQTMRAQFIAVDRLQQLIEHHHYVRGSLIFDKVLAQVHPKTEQLETKLAKLSSLPKHTVDQESQTVPAQVKAAESQFSDLDLIEISGCMQQHNKA